VSNKSSFTYDQTSGIHLMGGLCTDAKSPVTVKKSSAEGLDVPTSGGLKRKQVSKYIYIRMPKVIRIERFDEDIAKIKWCSFLPYMV